jgi:hypothetical protein
MINVLSLRRSIKVIHCAISLHVYILGPEEQVYVANLRYSLCKKVIS